MTLVLALALTACSGEDESPESDETPSADSSVPSDPSGGTGSEPADPSDPKTNILDWEKGEVANDTAIAGAKVDMLVPEGGAEARLTGVGQDGKTVIPAGKNRQITDAFIGSTHAVVVAQDKQETKPQVVTLVDLETGKTSTVDDPSPGSGGPWAMNGSTLAYATYSPGSDYCLATYDVDARTGEKGFCAEKGHGFSNVSVTPHGTTLMSFDNKRPVSCRTLLAVSGEKSTPVEGVPDCTGWEAVATADGHVWSSLPNENQIERGEFHATVEGKTYDLGAGAASTLTWCGDSAYFTRDSGKGRPAQMLRWTPEHTLEIVYESPGKGQAFLSPPTCSESVLSVSAYGQGGDERVTATVPG
ncbi:MAG: hypothetical protein L0H93_15630 [Nocardioides sp.]|nr:hypothetical protein [Nocardioides sp.]